MVSFPSVSPLRPYTPPCLHPYAPHATVRNYMGKFTVLNAETGRPVGQKVLTSGNEQGLPTE